jgi:hypothetical protein
VCKGVYTLDEDFAPTMKNLGRESRISADVQLTVSSGAYQYLRRHLSRMLSVGNLLRTPP